MRSPRVRDGTGSFAAGSWSAVLSDAGAATQAEFEAATVYTVTVNADGTYDIVLDDSLQLDGGFESFVLDFTGGGSVGGNSNQLIFFDGTGPDVAPADGVPDDSLIMAVAVGYHEDGTIDTVNSSTPGMGINDANTIDTDDGNGTTESEELRLFFGEPAAPAAIDGSVNDGFNLTDAPFVEKPVNFATITLDQLSSGEFAIIGVVIEGVGVEGASDVVWFKVPGTGAGANTDEEFIIRQGTEGDGSTGGAGTLANPYVVTMSDVDGVQTATGFVAGDCATLLFRADPTTGSSYRVVSAAGQQISSGFDIVAAYTVVSEDGDGDTVDTTFDVTFNGVPEVQEFGCPEGAIEDVELLTLVQLDDTNNVLLLPFDLSPPTLPDDQHLDSGRNRIDGGPGDDRLLSGANRDWLLGGSGDDMLFGGADPDLLQGDAGNDVAYGMDGSDCVDGGSNNDTLFGGGGDDVLHGQGGVDIMYGDAGNDALEGQSGDDILVGGSNLSELDPNKAGNSITFDGNLDPVFDPAETFDKDSGSDTLLGGTGNDTLFGDNVTGTGVIVATSPGDGGVDVLSGGAGADTLTGGKGDDLLYGGTIAAPDDATTDTFDYNDIVEKGDTIFGFNTGDPTNVAVGGDLIDISDVLVGFGGTTVADAVTGGFLGFADSGSGGTDVLVEAAGGGASDVLATLDGLAFVDAVTSQATLDDNIIVV